jgi:hypothetical protein
MENTSRKTKQEESQSLGTVFWTSPESIKKSAQYRTGRGGGEARVREKEKKGLGKRGYGKGGEFL